jgi:hypothetical protein
MKAGDTRQYLEAARDAFERRAVDQKDSHLVLERLGGLYVQMNDTDRCAANEVITDWALSGDDVKRFDALALIDEMGIHDARPALELLAQRLERDSSPGARYERRKVMRILDGLAAKTPRDSKLAG